MPKTSVREKDDVLLVEFKAPKGLVDAFDVKLNKILQPKRSYPIFDENLLGGISQRELTNCS